MDNNMDSVTNLDSTAQKAENTPGAPDSNNNTQTPTNADKNMEWYAIQTYSGSEVSVKNAILNLIAQNDLTHRVGQIVVPMEKIMESNRKIVEKSLYSGYVFAQLDLDVQLWQMIQNLPRVGRFIGEAKKPTPISQADVDKILDKVRNPNAPRPKVLFDKNEIVRINDGPFANFEGVVEDYNIETKMLKLSVKLLGRDVPVEMSYQQVEKII